MKIKSSLLWLFIVGFIIRIALLFYDYSFDVNSHMGWGREVVKYGIAGLYERKSIERYSTIYPNYPPVAIYLFTTGNLLNKSLFNLSWYLNTHIKAFPSVIMHYFDIYRVYQALVKLPAVFADLGIAYYLYLMVKKMRPHNTKAPLIAAAFVLLNPAFFYNSALWGQIDSLPLIFLIASCYYLLFRKSYILPSILITLSILSKQSSVIFVPFFFMFLFRMYGWKKLLIGVTVSLITFIILFIPFFPDHTSVTYPFIAYWNKMILVSGLPYVNNYAFNFWALITNWKNILDTELWFGMPYRVWGYIFSVVCIIPVMLITYKRKWSTELTIHLLFVVAVTVFMFFTKIHERHFLQALIFAIPLAVTDKRKTIALVLLSTVHFLNLYHNWAVPEVSVLVTALHTTAFHMSAVIILMLGSVYLAYKKAN